MKRIIVLVAVQLLVALGPHAAEQAQLLSSADPVEGAYIIHFAPSHDEGTAAAIAQQMARHDATVTHEFGPGGFEGVVLAGVPSWAVDDLRQNPNVIAVEEVSKVRIAAKDCLYDPNPNHPANMWGLDTTDQRSSAHARTDGTFNYCSTGTGVRAYVVDTGVRASMTDEFGSRVEQPVSFVSGPRCESGGGGGANAAHGTSVASILAGDTFGVAQGVTIVDIRTLDCTGQGDSATVTQALEWILADPERTGPAVVNLSLSFPRPSCGRPTCHPTAMEEAVEDLVNAGVTVVAAAGNNASDVGGYIPARSAAITAGGLSQDGFSRWGPYTYVEDGVTKKIGSNYGTWIDLYAPAQFVESASNVLLLFRSQMTDCNVPSGQTCTSGTSFAAPHVAGAAARYLQSNPSASQSAVLSYLLNEAASGNGIQVDNGYSTTRPVLNISDCENYETCP